MKFGSGEISKIYHNGVEATRVIHQGKIVKNYSNDPVILTKVDYSNIGLNTSFEDAKNHWTEAYTGSASIDNALSTNGNNSLKISCVDQPKTLQQNWTIPNGHRVFVVFDFYLASGSFSSNTCGRITDGTGNAIQSIFYDPAKIGQWQKISYTVAAANGGLRIYLGRATNNTVVANFDSIMAIDLTAIDMEAVADPKSYFPYVSSNGSHQDLKYVNAIQIPIITDTHLRGGVDGDTSVGDVYYKYYAAQSHVRNFVDVVNNNMMPDFVLHLGDVSDYGDDEEAYAEFISYWHEITCPSFVLLGNHELNSINNENPTPTATMYRNFVSLMGYENLPVNVGSVFNRSFVVTSLNGSNKIRIITCDTQLDSSDNHIQAARLQAAVQTWLSNELRTTAEKNVILAIHINFEGLEEPYKTQLDTLVTSAIAANPGLKVTMIAGHAHETALYKYDATSFSAYTIPCSIYFETGKYSTLNVDADGNITFVDGDLFYPYPTT